MGVISLHTMRRLHSAHIAVGVLAMLVVALSSELPAFQESDPHPVDGKTQIFQAGYQAGQQAAKSETDAKLSKAIEAAQQQKKIADAALQQLAEETKQKKIASAKKAVTVKEVATKKTQEAEKAKKAAEVGKKKAEEIKQKEEKAKAAADLKTKKLAVEKAKEVSVKKNAREKRAQWKKSAKAARKKKAKATKAARKARAEKKKATKAAEKAKKSKKQARRAAIAAAYQDLTPSSWVFSSLGLNYWNGWRTWFSGAGNSWTVSDFPIEDGLRARAKRGRRFIAQNCPWSSLFGKRGTEKACAEYNRLLKECSQPPLSEEGKEQGCGGVL